MSREVEKAFLAEATKSSSKQVFKQSDSVEPWDESADFSRLAAKYNTEYVLEFRTRIGMFGYKPLAWKTYQMNYFADMVLVRLKDQKAVWKVSCDVRAADENPLTLPGQDFLARNGELFKAAAAYATSTCGKDLAREFRSRING